MTIQQYIDNLNRLYQTGNAREHSYRGDLQTLLSTLLPEILVTNEPARIECGAPDYVLTKGKHHIPVGYIEAKDVGVKLDSKILKEQFDRYRLGLSNLIITDYLTFEFYRDGEKVKSITIGNIVGSQIISNPEQFSEFESLIKNFVQTISQTIKNPQRLAEMLAGKARLMADIIEKSLNADDENERLSELKSQMVTFKNMLIHDIDNKSFSDIYSQTIAYGMFAARYNDPTLDTFSRLEAAELIPKSNPFLRKLFQDIAGFDLDDRLVWIVEELVQIFLATDVAKIMQNFGKSTKMEDPIIHFYETFLAQYDKNLRKVRGVWYTPQPVVNFIVRAVDDILKDEFGLPQGLADTSKTKIKVESQIPDARSATGFRMVEKEVHRVQILDPATGTGTFLAETVKHIHSKFKGMEGLWSKYVKNDLIPRLNGFELLMASYAMAHLKMDMLLKETGYKSDDDQRFRIFLTNSLEEAHPDSGTLFSSWLSDESTQANKIKKETPVMVVMGNPPYSGESANKGKWIMDLIEDYKKEPGGKEKLKERNPKWINDDYVKFIRFAQYFINKNGNGVLAFINPHGFLDNPTFRGMRWNLLKEFDKIFTIDLHGNSKKKEISPDGSVDQNVFDIMQGVSINLFVKTGNKKLNDLGQVFHYDLYGKRNIKYEFLNQNTLQSIAFKLLENIEPNFYMVQKDNSVEKEYNNGISLKDVFTKYSIGVQTHRDELVIDFNEKELFHRFNNAFNNRNDISTIIKKFNVKEGKSWNLLKAIDKEGNFKGSEIKKITYRALDSRYIYYNDNFVDRTRKSLGKNILNNNLVINFPKIVKVNWNHVLISKSIPTAISLDINGTYFSPLYLYNEKTNQTSFENTTERVPNLNMEIVSKIEKQLKLAFVPEENLVIDLAEGYDGTFAPVDLLDYIYAVLHSPKYRETYKEFLKIDFPRIPYPIDQKSFWELVYLGRQIRELHLLESEKVTDFISSYPEDGSNVVTKPSYKNGSVYINDTQYFANVPEMAWNFYIGGYQPAQKWLKDRRDMELSYDDIIHYNKMIVALTETDRLMKEIDRVFEL
ncbi:DNA methyltransferase [Chryseobacterium piscium]|uniref:site-specific DNA-methyltransferase (adenine-specific) n=1 Tax=Chryseobacterium piscium TaxID=333702 RepID=A0A3D9BNN3_9FLAO|nr:type ISP restriction/modification enzyme [Chryseobacterium piscium]REC55077.1 DNA methyltransferase [Chryseobacterium piscium]